MTRSPLATLVAAALLLTACGGSRDPAQSGVDGGADDAPDDNADTDGPVQSEPLDPDIPMDEQESTWTLVEPIPGMDDVRAIEWDDAQLLDEPRIRVLYWSGVEPCHVLDSVEVEETDETVTITLYEGSEPQEGGEPPVCVQIARQTAVDIRLDAPVGDREIIDGAAG